MDPASLDAAVDRILCQYEAGSNLDGATEEIRTVLSHRLRNAKVPENQRRLLEVNLMGNLAGWIELVIEEKQGGRNLVPDFARNLKHVFISHCRKHRVDPQQAYDMAMELTSAILDLAVAFQRHMNLSSDEMVDVAAAAAAATADTHDQASTA